MGEAGDVYFPPNCCDVELEQGNKFCVKKSLNFRQHAASIYGFLCQFVRQCVKKKFGPLLSKVGG